MSPLDLSPVLKDYEGKWIALSEDNKAVYGSGDTAKEAVDKAKKSGHLDYYIFYVRPFNILFSGISELVF